MHPISPLYCVTRLKAQALPCGQGNEGGAKNTSFCPLARVIITRAEVSHVFDQPS